MIRPLCEMLISRSIERGRRPAPPLRWLANRWPRLGQFESDARRLDAALRPETRGANASPPTPASSQPQPRRRIEALARVGPPTIGAAAGLALAASLTLSLTNQPGSSTQMIPAGTSDSAATVMARDQSASNSLTDGAQPSRATPSAQLGWESLATELNALGDAWAQRVGSWTTVSATAPTPPSLIDAAADGVHNPLAGEWRRVLADLTALADAAEAVALADLLPEATPATIAPAS